MSEWITVASAASIPIGEMKAVTVAGIDIAIYHVDECFYATDNVCTHAFAFLTDGFLEDDQIECPLHGGRFDVATGKGLCDPITCDLRAYPVRVEGGDIQVCLEVVSAG